MKPSWNRSYILGRIRHAARGDISSEEIRFRQLFSRAPDDASRNDIEVAITEIAEDALEAMERYASRMEGYEITARRNSDLELISSIHRYFIRRELKELHQDACDKGAILIEACKTAHSFLAEIPEHPMDEGMFRDRPKLRLALKGHWKLLNGRPRH